MHKSLIFILNCTRCSLLHTPYHVLSCHRSWSRRSIHLPSRYMQLTTANEPSRTIETNEKRRRHPSPLENSKNTIANPRRFLHPPSFEKPANGHGALVSSSTGTTARPPQNPASAPFPTPFSPLHHHIAHQSRSPQPVKQWWSFWRYRNYYHYYTRPLFPPIPSTKTMRYMWKIQKHHHEQQDIIRRSTTRQWRQEPLYLNSGSTNGGK